MSKPTFSVVAVDTVELFRMRCVAVVPPGIEIDANVVTGQVQQSPEAFLMKGSLQVILHQI